MTKEYVREAMPFGDNVLVFKVGTLETAKIFALVSLDSDHYLMLKCNPDKAIELRDKHPEIEGAYHMNKRHWNGISTDGSLSRELILEMIDHSYELTRRSLPKKVLNI